MKKFISGLISVSLIAASLVMPMTASAAEDYADYAKIAEENINPNRIVQPAVSSHYTERNSNYSGRNPWVTGRWVVYELNPDSTTNAKWWGAEGIHFASSETFDSTIYNWKQYQPNTNYVYSFEMKNMSAEGITPKFCIAQWSYDSEDKETRKRVVDFRTTDITSRDGQKVTVTLSTDNVVSSGSMGFPDGVTRNGIANPVSADGSVVYLNMDSGYIGIEQAAEITNEALGSPITVPGGSIQAKIQNLNQCGDTGKLGQAATFVALNADRTAIVENISIVTGEDGEYTINIADTVAEGDYVILARSGYSREGALLQKGLPISVINPENEDWQDYAKIADEDINPNRFASPVDSGHFTSKNSHYSGNMPVENRWVKYIVNEDASTNQKWWGAEGTYLNAWTSEAEPFNWTEWQANTNYVYSFELKNMSAEGITPKFCYTQWSVKADGTRRADLVNLDIKSREGQLYTVTLSTDVTASPGSLGFPDGVAREGVPNPTTPAGSIVSLNMDNAYIGIEQYAEITNEMPAEVETGSTVAGKVEVLNQRGDKGKLGQDFEVLALNADRTAIAEGITATKGENGEYTVSVGEDVSSGNYVVLAKAVDSDVVLQKGATFEVINLAEMDLTDKAKIAEEDINPNRFKTPVNSGHFTSANSNLARKTVDGRWAIYTVDNNETDDWWCNAGTYLNKWSSDETIVANNFNWTDWQGNTDYVWSFEVKNMSAEGITPRFGFAQISLNTSGSRVFDFKTFDVTSRDGQMLTVTLSTDATGNAPSMGFPNGVTVNGIANPKTADGSVVYLNMDKAYIGIEQAAEITNVATSSTIVMPGDTISAKAEILNQCGDKGKLAQDIEFMVLDDERSEIIEDITVTPGENGEYTINVSDTAWAGNFVILARAEESGLQLGLEITVSESFEDTPVASAPQNMLAAVDSTYYVNRHGALANIIAHDDSLGRGEHLAENIIEYTCDASATLYAPAINGSRIDNSQIKKDSLFNWTQFEKDATYRVEVKVQNADTTYEPYFGFVASAGDGVATERGYKLEKITATGDEWQTISTVFTPTINGSNSSYVLIGYPTGQSAINGETITPVTGWKVNLDKTATVITKLVPAEVRVTEVEGAEELTFKAEVINHEGTTQGIANQNFTWFAMNTERTERIDSITLTPSADTTEVTVEFAEDLADGTYTIVAISNDYAMVKGYNYEKTSAPAEFAVTSTEFGIGELTVNCDGIPAEGKTIYVYFAKYVDNLFSGAEVEPIVFDGTKSADSKTVPFSTGTVVKAFIWDNDMNALLETPLIY